MATAGLLLRKNDVIGKYRVERCLGYGGMGEVYLVRHLYLNTLRALKLLRPTESVQGTVLSERFLREAKIASRIQHKNLIAVMDVENDSESGFFYIVMEYVNGNSLQEILKNGPLSEDQAIHIVAEVAEALSAAAEFNLVHRDIKPANIMISLESEVKLADLGIAKSSDEDVSMTLTIDNTLVGTPAYTSPEQCRNAHNVDTRADIYSLGATLYEMVTGKPPFEGANSFDTIAHVLGEEPVSPDILNPNLSPELTALIRRMMAKRPEDRPQNIAELKDELKKFRIYNAVIPLELKSLIHETVEKEVQERTSTVIANYRKKRKTELIGASLATTVLLIVVCIIIVVKNGTYRREIKSYQDKVAQLEKENTNRENLLRALRENLKHQEKFNIQLRGPYAAAETIKQLKEKISELERQNQSLQERIETTAAEKPKPAESSAPPQVTQTPPPAPAPSPAAAPSSPERPAVRRQKPELSRKIVHAIIKTDFRRAFASLNGPELKALCTQNGFTLCDLSDAPSEITSHFIINPIRYYNRGNRTANKTRIHSYLNYLNNNGFEFSNSHFTSLFIFNGYRPQNGRYLELTKDNIITCMKYLIQIGAHQRPPIRIPCQLINVLSYAYRLDNPDEIIKLLIEEGGFDVNKADREGYTPLDALYLARFRSERDPFPVLLKLFKRHGAKHGGFSDQDIRLIEAIRENNASKVRNSIAAGADVKKRYPLNANSPLHFAVSSYRRNQDLAPIRALLNAGADPNAGPSYGDTLLLYCLRRKYSELAELLIRSNADVNRKGYDGKTALELAEADFKLRTAAVMIRRKLR